MAFVHYEEKSCMESALIRFLHFLVAFISIDRPAFEVKFEKNGGDFFHQNFSHFFLFGAFNATFIGIHNGISFSTFKLQLLFKNGPFSALLSFFQAIYRQ